MRRALIFIGIILLITGCSDEDRPYIYTTKISRAIEQGKININTHSKNKINLPPRIVAMKFNPAHPKKGDKISIDVRTDDPDGDDVTLQYEWSVNGKWLEGQNTDTLDIPLKKGDIITVRITPFDGKQWGSSITNMVTVKNSHPVVEPYLKDVFIKGNICYARVEAVDPDGDDLRFSIVKGPTGVNIDSNTGVLSWDMKQTTSPVNNINISIIDSDGAETRLKLKTGVCKYKS